MSDGVSLREYTCAFRLTSELVDLQARYVHPYSRVNVHTNKDRLECLCKQSAKRERVRLLCRISPKSKRGAQVTPFYFFLRGLPTAIFFACLTKASFRRLLLKCAPDSARSAERVQLLRRVRQKEKRGHKSVLFSFLVEPTGVEPVSENLLI